MLGGIDQFAGMSEREWRNELGKVGEHGVRNELMGRNVSGGTECTSPVFNSHELPDVKKVSIISVRIHSITVKNKPAFD